MQTGPRLGWEAWFSSAVGDEALKCRVVWSTQIREVAALYF